MIEQKEEYSNHNLALNKIAQQMGCDVKLIRRIVHNFFSRYGLKFFIAHGDNVNIQGLGKFVSSISGKNSITERSKRISKDKRARRYRKLKRKLLIT